MVTPTIDQNINQPARMPNEQQQQQQPQQPQQQAIQPVVIPAPASFHGQVMPFDRDDVPTWLQHFECVLRIHQVRANDRYDYLMASLSKDALAPISLSLKNPPDTDQYDWLKNLLQEAHGKSTRERLRQLLEGEKIGDRRPSVFLNHLRSIAPDHIEDEIVKEVWWRELPSSTRAIMSTTTKATLNDYAKMADTIASEIPVEHTIAKISTTEQRTTNDDDDMQEVLRLLRLILRGIQTPLLVRPSRPETRRDKTPAKRATSVGPDKSDSTLCYYHETYGKEAKKCRDPCTFKKEN